MFINVDQLFRLVVTNEKAWLETLDSVFFLRYLRVCLVVGREIFTLTGRFEEISCWTVAYVKLFMGMETGRVASGSKCSYLIEAFSRLVNHIRNFGEFWSSKRKESLLVEPYSLKTWALSLNHIQCWARQRSAQIHENDAWGVRPANHVQACFNNGLELNQSISTPQSF